MTTIGLTGGSSGFGAISLERFASSGARVFSGARAPSADAIPLDLTQLSSVRAFAECVRERLGESKLTSLVLNAGTIRGDDTHRTVDGYETTFAANHLAHYLLLRLLMPSLGAGARIVLTTSGTHDPENHAGLVVPRHASADLLAHPDRDDFHAASPREAGEHAYTASKLCGVLTVRSLNAHHDIRARHISAIAFDPGQVFGTGLARGLSMPRRFAWSLLGTPLGTPLRTFVPTLNSRAAAGAALAKLALGAERCPGGASYAALRRGEIIWTDPSTMGRNDDLARALWNDSARLVGLPN
ncbi:SDR family NAD(P)-dependent oxidoreductase [Agromyces laixinhei]|uniref:SDR family NAD(P)-dependent oxidoreductase n=1 Tax=Agromyces laixinhei TaxID=2585717 RepID=UPI001115B7E3|nr:SDR family NAD(P)-dependent oxidoreductase [Agromyces laixinhei]